MIVCGEIRFQRQIKIQYQDGCRKLVREELPLTFDNLETYCRKLVMIYKNELF